MSNTTRILDQHSGSIKTFNLKTHTIVLLVGPSNCGKSYFVNKKVEELKAKYPNFRFPVLSSDQNRRFLLGEEADKHNPKMMVVSRGAFELLYKQLDELTSWPVNNEIIFVDATHLTDKARKPILDIAAKNYYNVAAIVFKYDTRRDYFKHAEKNNKIIAGHVEKFYGYTLRSLKDIKTKFFVKSYDIDSHNLEIEDYSYYCSHILGGNNYFIIGDVHGSPLLKDAVLYCSENKRIPILVGDIVDKNTPENIILTINFVYDRVKLGEMLMVVGNHDYAVYSWLTQNKLYSKDIIEKYFESALYIDGETKEKFIWLIENSRHFYLHENLKFVVTHAPCESKYLGKLGYLKQQRNFRYGKRDEFNSPEEWSESVVSSIGKIESPELYSVQHIFGHLAFNKYLKGNSYLGIDTGACYGNFLSGFDVLRHKVLTFGEYKDSDKLVKINTINRHREFDLTTLSSSERGRIYYSATDGLPVTSCTICPADKTETELESLEWALNYYDGPVVMQVKWMGSWSCIRLQQDIKNCKTFSRNGFLVKREGLEDAYKELIDKLDWSNVKEYIIGAELMPWSFLGDSLIDREFYGLHFLTDKQIQYLKEYNFVDALNKLNNLNIKGNKPDIIKEHGHHIWSTVNACHHLNKENYHLLDELKKENDAFYEQVDLFAADCKPYFRPFVIFKVVYQGGNEEIFANNNTLAFDWFNQVDSIYLVNKEQKNWLESAYNKFDEFTKSKKEEGVVVKPLHIQKDKAPALKVRNPEYLRLAYGFDYQMHLDYHRDHKRINRKLQASIQDWSRALKILEIPVKDLHDKNDGLLQLYADFVVEERYGYKMDPRL